MFGTFSPSPILFSIFGVDVYWYGLVLTLGGVLVYFLVKKIIPPEVISAKQFNDLAFYLVLFGLLGARLYHVLNELGYYTAHPGEIIAIWNGGMAWHGAWIAGLLVLIIFCKRQRLNIWKVADHLTIFLPVGQALGRLGNFFNQELFGKPTALPWKIYISPANRPAEFINFSYFHPTFLYEALLNIILFAVLFFIYKYKKLTAGLLTLVYLIGYSVIRFSLEFIRTDRTPAWGGLRLPQWVSLLVIIACVGIIIKIQKSKVKSQNYN